MGSRSGVKKEQNEMIEFIEFPALGALIAFGVTIIGLVIATKEEQDD
jgi:hypothetical protein